MSPQRLLSGAPHSTVAWPAQSYCCTNPRLILLQNTWHAWQDGDSTPGHHSPAHSTLHRTPANLGTTRCTHTTIPQPVVQHSGRMQNPKEDPQMAMPHPGGYQHPTPRSTRPTRGGVGGHPRTRVGDAAGLGADSGCGEQGGRCRAGRRAPVSAPACRELGWRGASTLPGQAVLWEAGSAVVPPPWALPPAGTGRAEAAPLSGTGRPHGHGPSLLQKGLGDRFLELWGRGWLQVVIFCPE